MDLSPKKLNRFLLLKLPSAFLCGVRVKSLNHESCMVTVRHRWINQNPFNSMYFAVQAMAAELSTGALVMSAINSSGAKISMLVASHSSTFSKKATGTITFICNDGHLLEQAVQSTLSTGEGVTVWLTSIGTNEEGEKVSVMKFEWSIRAKR